MKYKRYEQTALYQEHGAVWGGFFFWHSRLLSFLGKSTLSKKIKKIASHGTTDRMMFFPRTVPRYLDG
jgi:hypothetical protein